VRSRTVARVGVLSAAEEVVQGRLAIAHVQEVVCDAMIAEAAQDQLGVGDIVFDQENDEGRSVRVAGRHELPTIARTDYAARGEAVNPRAGQQVNRKWTAGADGGVSGRGAASPPRTRASLPRALRSTPSTR
jgi:hypothetical protein